MLLAAFRLLSAQLLVLAGMPTATPPCSSAGVSEPNGPHGCIGLHAAAAFQPGERSSATPSYTALAFKHCLGAWVASILQGVRNGDPTPFAGRDSGEPHYPCYCWTLRAARSSGKPPACEPAAPATDAAGQDPAAGPPWCPPGAGGEAEAALVRAGAPRSSCMRMWRRPSAAASGTWPSCRPSWTHSLLSGGSLSTTWGPSWSPGTPWSG